MGGPTVIASDPKSTYEVRFEGADDPDGGDIQLIPEEIVRTPAFAKAISQGIFEVIEGEENEAVREALTRQNDAFWRRAKQDKDSAMATLEAPADNDMIVINCIGPGSRPGAICGEEVPVRQREAVLNPPLCARHAGLAAQCVRRGTGPWMLEED
jgi:hypothetical protein